MTVIRCISDILQVMKTLLTALLSTCLLAGVASAKAEKPLDNQELYQIRMKWRGNADEITGVKGKPVKLKVRIHVRQDDSVWCTLVTPSGESWTVGCRAHLDNITKDTYDLKNDEVCLIEGVIAEDALCYGAFWVDVNKLTKLKKGPAAGSTTAKKP